MASEQGHLQSQLALAELYFHIFKKYDLAEKYFKLAIGNGDIDAYNGLGRVYSHQKKYDLAEEAYKTAIENGETSALISLAVMYYRYGKHDLAIKHLKLASEKKIKDADNLLKNLYGL